ncbi:Polysaccharide deacetylase protein, partial [human gut metagenome]
TVGNMITILTENYVENGYIHRFDSKTNLYVPIKKKLGYSVVTLNELQEIDAINSKRYPHIYLMQKMSLLHYVYLKHPVCHL